MATGKLWPPSGMSCTHRMIHPRGHALIVLLASAPAWANFPPLPQLQVDPAEAAVGKPVRFSAAGTVDPDMGPAAVTFSWTFDDGTSATSAEVTRTFDTPGAVRVTLTVSDGADTAVLDGSALILEAPVAGCCAKSSPLVPGEAGALWVVNPDSDSVTRLLIADSTTREIPVCRRPGSVAWDASARLLYVACETALRVLDAGGAMVRELDGSLRPAAVVTQPATGRVLVTDQATPALLVFEPGGRAELARYPLAADPSSIALTADGTRAFVSHFLTRGQRGRVSRVDLTSGSVTGIELPEDPGPDTTSSGRGFPNLLGALAVEPAGKWVWVGGLKSNTASGPRLTGSPLAPTNWVRGFAARLEVTADVEPPERRLDTNDADSVTGIAFSANGRYAFLAHQGAGTLSVYDVPAMGLSGRGDGSTVPFVARIPLCDAPRGAILSPDGTRLFVSCWLARTVAVIDLSNPREPRLTAQVEVTKEPLSAQVALGKRLFFRSSEPKHSKGNYVACASCHPDGASDGRTWDTSQKGEGLRNTRDLRGHGTAEGPLHWSANFDEVQDFERDIVEQFGGTGLAQDGQPPFAPLGRSNAGRSTELDALAAFVASLREAPPSPFRSPDGTLTASALRGRGLFFAAGCDQCHSGPLRSDSSLEVAPSSWKLWDIGTITPMTGERLGQPLAGIDTPGLVGVWASAPYLHDGSAATLRDVLRTSFKAARLEGTSDADLDDLVTYLASIDGRPEVSTAPTLPADESRGRCACSSGPLLPLFAFVLLSLRRRRRHV